MSAAIDDKNAAIFVTCNMKKPWEDDGKQRLEEDVPRIEKGKMDKPTKHVVNEDLTRALETSAKKSLLGMLCISFT